MSARLDSLIAREAPALSSWQPLLPELGDPLLEAVAYRWLSVCRAISDLRVADGGQEILEALAESSGRYSPDPDGMFELVVPSLLAAIVPGTAEDMDHGELQLEDLLAAAERLFELLDEHTAWGLIYDQSVSQVVVGDLVRRLGPSAGIGPLSSALIGVQRVLWLLECGLRGGIVLSPDDARPLPTDPGECLLLLVRISANQPLLACHPELARVLPMSSADWLPGGPRINEHLISLGLTGDAALAGRFSDEILNDRHFALDHLARVEIDDLGVFEVSIAPERTSQQARLISFFVHHRLGGFVGVTIVPFDGYNKGKGITVLPALMWDDDMEAHDALVEALRLLSLAVWRDLVVAEVRDQQFETRTVVAVSRQQRRSAQRQGGDTGEVIRYLPRRLVEARGRGGADGRRETALHPVGMFVRQLRPGDQRSQEATDFAAEVGMPLRDHQTIVRPHYRGGSPEEREAASTAGDLPAYRWRSWSATDLIRTLRAASALTIGNRAVTP